MLKLHTGFFIICVLFFVSCKKPNPNSDYISKADCTVLIDSLNTYNISVKPIFDHYCAYSPCHNTATAKHKVILDNFSDVVAAVNKYPTRFLCGINQDGGTKPMPNKLPKIADSLVLKITCWIKNGMQE